MSLHIAVDLGGTNCRVAGYESYDVQRPSSYTEFPVQKVDKEAPRSEKELAFDLDHGNLTSAIAETDLSPQSISLAVAGKVDKRRRTLLGAGNLVHWVNEKIVSALGAYFDCPVILGNDAEAAALADALYGHGQDLDFLEMIWGSGVGGCCVYWRDGLPYTHTMEPGHIQVRGGTAVVPAKPCGCGRHYCLESYCGGDNIGPRHGRAENVSGEEWQRYAHTMAQGAMDVLMLHPDLKRVIFTGGVICKQSWLLPLIEAELALQNMFDPPDVVLSKFGESAGTLGALALGNRLLNGDTVVS